MNQKRDIIGIVKELQAGKTCLCDVPSATFNDFGVEKCQYCMKKVIQRIDANRIAHALLIAVKAMNFIEDRYQQEASEGSVSNLSAEMRNASSNALSRILAL